MALLAVISVIAAVLTASVALGNAQKTERFTADSSPDVVRTIEERIDRALTLTLSAIGAGITFSAMAARGPTWAAVLGILVTTATLLMLRESRRSRGKKHPSQR